MKHISMLTLTIMMVLGISKFASSADLYSYNIYNCEFWTPAPSASGYMCANWPFPNRVADAQSYGRAINDMEKRIEALEKKIQELENKKP